MSGSAARDLSAENNEPSESQTTPEYMALREPRSAERIGAFQVPATHRQWPGKRVFDIVGALALFVVFSPLILCVAVWLWVTGGPILFGHQRIGKGGRPFNCYKFRTMVPNADQVLERLFEREPDLRIEWVLNHKLKDDPRVTRLGEFLRKTSLDELPQLWNVLRGEMSLVGPRPIVKDEIFRYGHAIRHYLAVKPGITGLWQVSGRNDTTYGRRVAMDRLYAMNMCVGLDTRILFRTMVVVCKRSGAY